MNHNIQLIRKSSITTNKLGSLFTRYWNRIIQTNCYTYHRFPLCIHQLCLYIFVNIKITSPKFQCQELEVGFYFYETKD